MRTTGAAIFFASWAAGSHVETANLRMRKLLSSMTRTSRRDAVLADLAIRLSGVFYPRCGVTRASVLMVPKIFLKVSEMLGR